jgi:hypothetical protein
MSGTHGDLFSEIGRLVVAAHKGEPIDLKQTSEELAERYINLGVPAETMERVIARAMGAVGISLALVRAGDWSLSKSHAEPIRVANTDQTANAVSAEEPRSPSALFPSGVRLALLS